MQQAATIMPAPDLQMRRCFHSFETLNPTQPIMMVVDHLFASHKTEAFFPGPTVNFDGVSRAPSVSSQQDCPRTRTPFPSSPQSVGAYLV